MMVTGRHGVRMQWNYTQDAAGLAGTVSAASPRWLRLTRSGDTVTGYDSADGTHWTRWAAVGWPGCPAPSRAACSPRPRSTTPSSGLQRVRWRQPGHRRFRPRPAAARRPAGRLDRHERSAAPAAGGRPGGGFPPVPGQFTVTGTGDIAPSCPGARRQRHHVAQTLIGTFAGLIAMVVVGVAVHHGRVPARPDPQHAGRQPAPRPGAGGQGGRDRRGHLRRGAGRRGRRGRARRAGAAGQRRLRLAGDRRHRAARDRRHRGAARRRRRPRAGHRRPCCGAAPPPSPPSSW